MKKGLYYILCGWLLLSCGKPAPQVPANKNNTGDPEVQALLNLNKNLALREDSILAEYVKTNRPDYMKSELGFWYKIEQTAHGPLLKEKELVSFRYEMSALDGTALDEGEKEIETGRKEVVPGLEEGLKLMRKGETATFIIPWYLAYGMRGDSNNIPPYTSLIYRIFLLE